MTEIAKSPTLLTNYQTSISCTNAATGSPTVLPVGPVGQPPPTITPTNHDDITCTLINTALPPPFPACDPHAFVTFETGASDTGLLEYDLSSGVSTVLSRSLGFSVNGIGYNMNDDRIYGSSGSAGYLIVIGAGGATARIGPVPGLMTLTNVSVGDVDANGLLYLTDSTKPGTDAFVINVTPGPHFLEFQGPPIPNPFTPGELGADWSFDAAGYLNTVTTSGGEMKVFRSSVDSSPAVLVAASSIPADDLASNFGATFEDSADTLYAIANDSGNLYRVVGGAIALFGFLPQYASSQEPVNFDAARCRKAPPPCACTKSGAIAISCLHPSPALPIFSFATQVSLTGATSCALSVTPGAGQKELKVTSPATLHAGLNSIEGTFTGISNSSVNFVLQCIDNGTTLCLWNLGGALPVCH